MKNRLLIIIAVFLVLIPWIRGLDFGINNEVMVDGFTVSSVTVMTLTIVFSLVSWFLFSWASKNIKIVGIPLSIITAVSVMLPFSQALGPMAAIIVGLVAGFVAFMIQKKMIYPSNLKLLLSLLVITLVKKMEFYMKSQKTESSEWHLIQGFSCYCKSKTNSCGNNCQ